MRKQILGQPTPRQSQVVMSAALADIDNDPLDDERQQPDPYKTNLKKKSQTIAKNSLLILRMKNVSKHANEICIKYTKMHLKIHQQCTQKNHRQPQPSSSTQSTNTETTIQNIVTKHNNNQK
ncbi:unnamed protein product [Rotaria magnacalcarata]|nr:unnamed protein product [Rotaria magnacalcarata]